MNPATSSPEWPNAWLMCEDAKDLRVMNQLTQNVPVSGDYLRKKGITYSKMRHCAFYNPAQNTSQRNEGDPLPHEESSKDQSYANIIILNTEDLNAVEARCLIQCPISRTEIICYALAGSGFLDVRCDNKWVRINVKRGDLLSLPEDLYHRFTSTERIDEVVYFAGQSFCTPLVRIALESTQRVPNSRYSKRKTACAA